MPLSVPLPVQPVTVKVLPPAPVSVRLAVVMPLKPSVMPSVDDSEVLVRVKPPLLLAVTVSPVAALSVSDPLPVQPLTVKVLPPAVSVRLAVVIPLKRQGRQPGHRQRGVGQRDVRRHRVHQGVRRAGQRSASRSSR